MKIDNAIDITKLIYPSDVLDQRIQEQMLPEATLSAIEEVYMAAGLEKNCFCVFKVSYSDGINRIYFDYPTDMDDNKALEFSQKVFKCIQIAR